MARTILVFGATSQIAKAAMRVWATRQQCSFVLVARNKESLAPLAADLMARGAKEVASYGLDFAHYASHEAFVRELFDAHPISTTLLCHGALGEQKEDEKSVAASLEIIGVNYLSYVSLLTPIANLFAEKKMGEIVVVGSVAGDRGRQSNYIYGSAKGAMGLFAGGLRNRLQGCGVSLLLVKPGFVDTPMTAHVPKNFLFARPEAIGARLVKALDKKCDVVYLPFFWFFIMQVIKAIPEAVFKRLKL